MSIDKISYTSIEIMRIFPFLMDFIIKTFSRIDDSKVFNLICIDDVVLKFQQCLFELLVQC